MLLVITGKTAAGKDTLITGLLQKYPDFKKVLTSTSRSPREGEKNGIDYNFISENEFKQKIEKGEFLEYVEYGGNYYGTEKSRIKPGDNLIWKIDPSMAGKVKDIFPESLVLYINVADNVVLQRLKERGINGEELQERMADDQEFWNQYKDKYDYIIENAPGNLQVAIDKICQTINTFTLQASFLTSKVV